MPWPVALLQGGGAVVAFAVHDCLTCPPPHTSGYLLLQLGAGFACLFNCCKGSPRVVALLSKAAFVATLVYLTTVTRICQACSPDAMTLSVTVSMVAAAAGAVADSRLFSTLAKVLLPQLAFDALHDAGIVSGKGAGRWRRGGWLFGWDACRLAAPAQVHNSMHLEQECGGLAQSRHFIHLPAADTLLPEGWKWVFIARLGVAGMAAAECRRCGSAALLHNIAPAPLHTLRGPLSKARGCSPPAAHAVLVVPPLVILDWQAAPFAEVVQAWAEAVPAMPAGHAQPGQPAAS